MKNPTSDFAIGAHFGEVEKVRIVFLTTEQLYHKKFCRSVYKGYLGLAYMRK